MGLTPTQVVQPYKLTGIDEARADFDALQAHMGRHTTVQQSLDLARPSGGITVNGPSAHPR